MSEESMVEVVNEALASAGIEDSVTAVGEFYPRGHTGAGVAGGLLGGEHGETHGGAPGPRGTVGGDRAGARAHDAANGLPDQMLVGVSDTMVFGFSGTRRHADALVFRVPREGIEVQVHQ